MTTALNGSVGLSGRNLRQDTIIVQTLLKRLGMQLGLTDGLCGPKTQSAIIRYQSGFMRNPDGLVEPEGMTWRHLTGQQNARPAARSAVSPPVAPLRTPVRAPVRAPAPVAQPAAQPTPAPNSTTSFLTEVPKPARNTINQGLTSPSNDMLLRKFGAPRENYSQQDQPITNPKLKAMMVRKSVGPFTAYGLGPAVESLSRVMADVQREMPELYSALGNAGMCVVRNQRGSSTRISNHSWGTAIDMQINHKTDPRGNNKVYYGLTLLAPYFNKHGWYWGAAFRTEDGMHFECSASLIASFPNP